MRGRSAAHSGRNVTALLMVDGKKSLRELTRRKVEA